MKIPFTSIDIKIEKSKPTLIRPRYSLRYPKAVSVFRNFDTLPFTLLKEMCWNEKEGFCDEQFKSGKTPLLMWEITDWKDQIDGEIFSYGDEYYMWMYRPQLDVNNNSHIELCWWISQPKEFR